MASPPLRVLFLTPYFRPYLGGIERAIEQLSFQLMRRQAVAAVGVLTTKYAFPRIPQPHWADRETTPQGIAIFRLDGRPQRSIPLYSVPLVWFSPRQIRGYLEEFEPNVVHFVGDGWFWGHFWTWFWYRRRARFIFTPSFHTLPLGRQWLRPINVFLCRVVDRVVALTRGEGERVGRAYWVSPRKLEVIGWGVAPPGPAPAASNRGVLTILCVGRLGRHKGQEWLLKVYRVARPQFVCPTRLVLVGRDEGGEGAIRSQVQASGLEQEVTVTGEVSDEELAEWYSRSDLFTLFSRYEAFGLSFFEAMAWGVPVLTHDVGANRELLARGSAVVPRFDEAAAVGEMVRLVNDNEYRQRLGREGREYALAGFTWSAVAEKYLRVYQGSS
jgi:glycosyltransferase involved in cell wall biosynthesis